MKYIISADLWLTARIGQQPHLLKKQRQQRLPHAAAAAATVTGAGTGAGGAAGGMRWMLPAHRAFGKLHAHAIPHCPCPE